MTSRKPKMSTTTFETARGAHAAPRDGRSRPKTAPLPGELYAERRRCNRPNCRCAAGGEALHGPYLYRRWSEDGRSRRQYVRPADAERVRAALEAWRILHPPTRSTRDML